VEGLAVVGVMLLLMWVEPIPTLILLLFFILCSIFYLRLVSPLLSRLGHDRASYAGETFKIVSETLGGIKEIKVFYRENFFWERFRTNSRRALKVSARRETMNRVPAYLVELWGVLGLLLVIFSLLFQNENTQEVVTSLGLFVGASLRLIPSLNRVLISLQSLKLAKPAVDIVFRELTDDLEFRQPEEVVHFSTQLSFCKVTFSYTSVSEPVIKDASFNLMRGESVGIIGPSGTGKSTLIAILLGLLKPTSGQIIIDGQAIDSNKHLWQTQIAYVPQEIFLLDDTIRNNIAFGVSRDDVSSKKLMQSIEAAQLSDFVATLPSGLDTVVGERGVRLSGGQRQRIGLARALYFEPTVLVLDEATSALDSATETGVLRTLESLRPGVTMIFVSHRPSTLIFCDRKFRLNDGELTEIA
jgi:ABC-type bacteriocin/lantibiotic exporter with double-glycine peptidase domain